MIRKCALQIVVALLCGLSLLMAPSLGFAQEPPPAGVRINPGATDVAVGHSVELAVDVVEVEQLYGFDLRISFDPDVVEVVDADPNRGGVQVAFGTFLDPGLVVWNKVDNEAGTIQFVMTQLNPSQPKTGTGPLIVVKFTGKQVGAGTGIDFDHAELAQAGGVGIPTTSVPGRLDVVAAAGTEPTNTSIPTQDPGTTVPTPEPTATGPTPTQPPTATPVPPTEVLQPTASPMPTGAPQPTNGPGATHTTAPAGEEAMALPSAVVTSLPSVTPVGAIPVPSTPGAAGASAVPPTPPPSQLPTLSPQVMSPTTVEPTEVAVVVDQQGMARDVVPAARQREPFKGATVLLLLSVGALALGIILAGLVVVLILSWRR